MNAGLETSLALSVTGPRWAQPRAFSLLARDLDGRGAWIGRAQDCAVALDDPDRFVSLYHAKLDFADGSFWLTDHSTNGTTIDGAGDVGAARTGPIRLGKGQRQRLSAGARVRIGMFDIVVRPAQGAPGYGLIASPLDDLASGVPLDPLADLRARPSPAMPGLAPAAGVPADPFDALLAEFASPPAPEAAPLFRFSPEAPAPVVDFPDPAAPSGPNAASPVAPPAPAPPSGDMPRPLASDQHGGDMLNAITAEVVDASPALRAGALSPDAAGTARDVATTALAAFWCGLGIIPRSLRPEELVEVMGELGVAFREAADGLAGMARELRTDAAGANPLAAGHAGLRRYLDARADASQCLDEAVREIFALAGERDAMRQAAIRAGAAAMAKSLQAGAVEARIGVAVATRRPRARRAELWRLFSLMQEDLAALAELRFHKEVEERLRRAGQRPTRMPGGSGT